MRKDEMSGRYTLTGNAYLAGMMNCENYTLGVEKLKEMALKFKQKIQDTGSEKDTVLKGKSTELQHGVTYIENCASILKTTPLKQNYELDLRPGKVGKKISVKQLSSGYDPFSRKLSHLPLADVTLNQMLEIMHLLERNNPLVGYHQSLRHEILARLAFADVLLTKDSKKEKEGASQFSKALTTISQAMALVGYAPNRSVEIATIVRYGQIVYMIAKIYRLHQIPLPNAHQEVMNKAVRVLQKVAEDKNAKIIQQNKLQITVEDNGIGREQSEKLKRPNQQHKPFATKANEERVRLYKNKLKRDIAIITNDLYDENGVAAGTKVVITMPIQ